MSWDSPLVLIGYQLCGWKPTLLFEQEASSKPLTQLYLSWVFRHSGKYHDVHSGCGRPDLKNEHQ